MRKLALIAAVSFLTASAAFAAAPANSTLALIISKGMIMSAQGMDFEVNFKEDGTYDAGLFAGTYTVDGGKLCMEIPDAGITFCSDYPDGKMSGDMFQVETDNGPVDITVK